MKCRSRAFSRSSGGSSSRGFLTTLVALAVGAAFFFAPLLVFSREDAWPYLLAAWALLGFFLLCYLCWLWPALSRFSMGLGPLLGASLRLALGHILKSAAMAILWGAALYAGLSLHGAPVCLPCPRGLPEHISHRAGLPASIEKQEDKKSTVKTLLQKSPCLCPRASLRPWASLPAPDRRGALPAGLPAV